MALAALNTQASAGIRPALAHSQPKSGSLANSGFRGKNLAESRLTDQIQLSAQAKEKLSELSNSSKDLSALAKKVRDSADRHEEAARAAKIDKLKQQIKQLKMQLSLASGKEAKALIKNLKALAGELRQLAKDVASAGGLTIPAAKASNSSAEETGRQLVQALGGTGNAPDATGQQITGQDDQRTDREKLADAYLQAFEARPAVTAETNSRKEELREIKKLARALKLIAGEIKRKMKDDDDNKDLKEANDDLSETLSSKVESSRPPADDLTVEGAAPSTPDTGSASLGVQVPGVDVASVQTPIIQVQTYINVQISVPEA